MTDGLDLLKKDWKEKEKSIPQYSYSDIYKMLWKRSNSIVKWIFYISIFEFVLYITLPFIFPDFYKKQDREMEELHIKFISDIFFYLNYVVLLIFILWFYKNYKKISATDNIKKLMESILNTRKSVKYYVIYNLLALSIYSLIVIIATFKYDSKIAEALEKTSANGSTLNFWITTTAIILLTLALIIIFVWLFYQLLYGILLRKLKKNYKELEQIEM